MEIGDRKSKDRVWRDIHIGYVHTVFLEYSPDISQRDLAVITEYFGHHHHHIVSLSLARAFIIHELDLRTYYLLGYDLSVIISINSRLEIILALFVGQIAEELGIGLRILSIKPELD